MPRSHVLLLSLVMGCSAVAPEPEQVPPPAVLGLTVSALVAGERTTLEATGAQPGEAVLFGRGANVGSGPCPSALAGGCLGITQPVLLGAATADADGVAVLSIRVPTTVPSGALLHTQAAVLGASAALSNVVSASVEVDGDGDGFPPSVDCDDTDATIYPGALERCDLVDQDCDSEVDEGPDLAPGEGNLWFRDRDGDGFGGGAGVLRCAVGIGFTATGDDCDDTDAQRYPGAPELCDGVNTSCDPGWVEDRDSVSRVESDGSLSAVTWVLGGSAAVPATGTFDGSYRLCPGEYHVAAQVRRNTVLEGVGAVADVVLSGNGAPVLEALADSLVLRGLTVQNGSPGVEFDWQAGDFTSEDMVYRNNTNSSARGGAISVRAANARIERSRFVDNTTLTGGDAVYTFGDGETQISDVEVVGIGGEESLYLGSRLVEVQDARVANGADVGVYITLDAEATLRRVEVDGATGSGIDVIDATAVIEDSTVTNSVTTSNGGGLHVTRSTVTVRNSLFEGNEGRFGGGIYATSSDVVLEGVIVASNTASISDSGVHLQDSTLECNANSSGEPSQLNNNGGFGASFRNGSILTGAGCTFAGQANAVETPAGSVASLPLNFTCDDSGCAP